MLNKQHIFYFGQIPPMVNVLCLGWSVAHVSTGFFEGNLNSGIAKAILGLTGIAQARNMGQNVFLGSPPT